MRSASVAALAAVLGVALLLANRPSQGQAVEPSSRPTWEYKSVLLRNLIDMDGIKVNIFNPDPESERKITSRIDEALNALGAEGWELVTEANGGLIFKRPK